MNLLLDTHALLWVLAESPRLGPATRQLLANPLNDVLVSAVSAWEIAIKATLGKLSVPPDIANWLPAQLANNRMTPLPITVAHAAGLERLPMHHNDPFDRLLIAQARVENLAVVTADQRFRQYEVRVIGC